ncbi:MAG: hypothetical protein NVS4B8_17740 [Herpetosiphon sp.]
MAASFALTGAITTMTGDRGLPDTALEEIANASLTGVSSPGAPLPSTQLAAVDVETANVRSGPGTKYAKTRRLTAGSIVTLLSQQDGWNEVRLADGSNGWILAELLRSQAAEPDDLLQAERRSRRPTRRVRPPIHRPTQPRRAPATSSGTAFGHRAAAIGMQAIGSPYVYGGAGPSVFDCSGVLVYTFRHLGLTLPHNAAAQFSASYGRLIWDVDQLEPGDMVFFRNTAGWGITHAALYVGDGMIVTANSPRTGVQYQTINTRYWLNHWAGAVRPYTS